MSLPEKLRALAEHWSGVDTDRRKLLTLAAEAEALERDAALGRLLRAAFKEHKDGWTIHETVRGAPSLETLDQCIAELAKEQP